jgi:hypothetical protein
MGRNEIMATHSITNLQTGEVTEVPFTDEEEAARTIAYNEGIKLSIISGIETLEAAITPRRMREAILGVDGGWLAAQEVLIAAERAKL